MYATDLFSYPATGTSDDDNFSRLRKLWLGGIYGWIRIPVVFFGEAFHFGDQIRVWNCLRLSHG